MVDDSGLEVIRKAARERVTGSKSEYLLQVQLVGGDMSALELALGFDPANPKPYKEFTYDGTTGDLTDIDSWVSSAKVVQLFNTHFVYDGAGNLTSVALTRSSDGVMVTKTFTYDVDGALVSIQVS